MNPKQIADQINHHLSIDRNFKRMFEGDKEWSLITFDITNTPPANFYAPYYQVPSIGVAKDIIRDVILNIPEHIFEIKYKEVMRDKIIDTTKPLFIAIYRPDRR